jgi:FtsP/CotA-like multicopper oxidase with cupredoxin domain
MRRKISFLTILVFLAATVTVSVNVRSAKAAVEQIHLYGSYASGWGYSQSSMTSPGPTITVGLNDVVNLTLTNADTGYYAPSHQFLLSYHNSSVPQSGDPLSSYFGPGTTITFSFTANISGAFTYYCTVHPSMMHGTFVVTPVVPEFSSVVALLVFMTAIVAVASIQTIRNRNHNPCAYRRT